MLGCTSFFLYPEGWNAIDYFYGLELKVGVILCVRFKLSLMFTYVDCKLLVTLLCIGLDLKPDEGF